MEEIQMQKKVEVFYESTPNPNSMKFVFTKMIANETVCFDDSAKTLRSPLAQKIFGFPWAAGVLVGPNFVTITKHDWVEWKMLADPLAALLVEHVERNEGVLLQNPEAVSNSVTSNSSSDPIVSKILAVIENDIKPAVAMDGGDVMFDRYENNVVYLRMLGACSGCPSSTATLKQGIETRLKEAVPEIKEVVAVD